MNLSQVCRHWRHVALSDPVLWSTIRLTPLGETPFVKLCLKRSKNHDLKVLYEDFNEYELQKQQMKVFDRSTIHLHQSQQQQTEQFDPAIFHLHRCRELELFFNDITWNLAVMQRFQSESAPKLVSFNVFLRGNSELWTGQPERTGDIFTGGAPRLSSLTLHGVSPLECHVPLSRITDLSLGMRASSQRLPDLNPAEIIGILREVAVTLKHLTLDGVHVVSDDDYPWSEIELPILVTLRFGNTDDEEREECEDYVKDVWQFLGMPLLEDLWLFDLTSSQVAWVLLALKGGRGAGIKSLSLYNVGMDELDEAITDILPNIHSLSLEVGTIPFDFPGLLNPNEHASLSRQKIIWPLLQCLTLTSWHTEEDTAIFRNLLRGRKALGCPIRRVVFRGYRLAYSSLSLAHEHIDDVRVEQRDDEVDQGK